MKSAVAAAWTRARTSRQGSWTCCVSPGLARQLKKSVRASEDAVADSDEPEVATEALRADLRATAGAHPAGGGVAGLLASPSHRWSRRRPGRRGSREQRGVPSSATARPTTGPYSGVSSARSYRSWISSTRHPYVFAAATAGRTFAAGWACYREWISWLWQGKVRAPGSSRPCRSGRPNWACRRRTKRRRAFAAGGEQDVDIPGESPGQDAVRRPSPPAGAAADQQPDGVGGQAGSTSASKGAKSSGRKRRAARAVLQLRADQLR